MSLKKMTARLHFESPTRMTLMRINWQACSLFFRHHESDEELKEAQPLVDDTNTLACSLTFFASPRVTR